MKKSIALLAVTAIMAQSSVVFAAETFTDLQGYNWAVPAIEDMAARGILSGVGNNKYAPGDNVTILEFASMAMRAYAGKEEITKLAEEQSRLAENIAYIEATNGKHWGNEIICASQKFGLTDKFSINALVWSYPATRADMAVIAMTIAEQMGKETFEIKDGIENNIGDYSKILTKLDDRNYILKAYSNGILCGVNDRGDYEPNAHANRAEAAAIMQRLVDPSKRVTVEIKQAPVEKPVNNKPGVYVALPDGSNVMPDGTILPAEGQIGPDGKVITRDKETGVLGFGNGQTGGIYTGVKFANGAEIEVDDESPLYAPDYDENINGRYEKKGKYTYWSMEWAMIDRVNMNNLKKNHADAPNGTVADINGNILPKGTTIENPEAFYWVVGDLWAIGK